MSSLFRSGTANLPAGPRYGRTGMKIQPDPWRNHSNIARIVLRLNPMVAEPADAEKHCPPPGRDGAGRIAGGGVALGRTAFPCGVCPEHPGLPQVKENPPDSGYRSLIERQFRRPCSTSEREPQEGAMKTFPKMRPILCLTACLMLALSPPVSQAQDPEDDEPVQGRDIGADTLLMQPGDRVGIEPGNDNPVHDAGIEPGDDKQSMEPLDKKAMEPLDRKAIGSGDGVGIRPGGDFRQPAMQPAAPATRMAPAQQAPTQRMSPGSLKQFNPQPEPPAAGQ
jgi:hypothetical protein